MKSVALTQARFYTGDTVLREHAVLIEGGAIAGLPLLSELPDGVERVDLSGAIVAPGFIDAQVNGGGGVLFNADPMPEALGIIAAAHERYGTLHWCPTVISADFSTMERALNAIKTVKGAFGVLGAHLEGPYLSQNRPGVHEARFIRPADDNEIDRLLAIGGISLVTVAPEAVEERHIRRFCEAGVRVFLGHTDATYERTAEAFSAGACGVTHLYNAMSQLTGRNPGVVGAAFNAKVVWAGVIADGFHVGWPSIQIAKELKRSRLFLVTDAMPPVGRPGAVYRIGSETITCQNGRCATSGGTLAGSALDMAGAVRNCVAHCGFALDETLRMASAYPALMLGLADRLGYIRPGYAADLVILDEALTVTGIVRDGALRFF